MRKKKTTESQFAISLQRQKILSIRINVILEFIPKCLSILENKLSTFIINQIAKLYKYTKSILIIKDLIILKVSFTLLTNVILYQLIIEQFMSQCQEKNV